jgi:hypothetical protein
MLVDFASDPLSGAPLDNAAKKRLRLFLAALVRHRPLLVLWLPTAEPAGQLLYTLVVGDGSLSWDEVDRASDGLVQALVYQQEELIADLAVPESCLRELLSTAVLLHAETDRARPLLRRLQLLFQAPEKA